MSAQLIAMAARGAAHAAGAAGAQGGPQVSAFLPLIILAGLVFVILFVPYPIVNTLLAWFASCLMQFRYGTVGNALKLSLLQLLVPVPMGIIAGVGAYLTTQKFMPGNPNVVLYGIAYGICAGLVIMWLFSAVIAARVYSVSILKGAVFNALLVVINASVGFVLHLAGCLQHVPAPGG